MEKVQICASCSDMEERELLRDEVRAQVGCIGKCARKSPELQGKVFAFLNDEFVICDTKEEFFAKMEELEDDTMIGKQSPLVDGFLNKAKQWQPELRELRRIALECGLTEELKWRHPCYMFHEKNIAILGEFKQYVAIMFFKGVLLKDPLGLLVQQTKEVQAARQLRFTDMKGIREREGIIKAYLQEAIGLEEAGMTVSMKKESAREMPRELEERFEQNPAFKEAFFALTPGRQRGYVLYFSAAKQAKTRKERVDNFMPKIMEGKGLQE